MSIFAGVIRTEAAPSFAIFEEREPRTQAATRADLSGRAALQRRDEDDKRNGL